MKQEAAAKDRFGEKTSTFEAYSKGSYDSLIEFTSIMEKGQKVLRTEGELYLYYPDANELIRLTGAALRQSLLGSDISYEDMTGEKDTLRDYDVTLGGTKMINGKECYELHLVAKTRKVAYPKQLIYVDTETFVVMKGEYSTSSDRVLKEIEVLSTMKVGERTIPNETKIVDTLKRNTSTIMKINSIEIDIPLNDDLFSIDSLTW
ncbi:MAG: outer membrane lipoprotein-sorting protein [Spirochaetia bacterium]|nr:outer membrane lipoprotein-sorting protein [Spirochaetia bacterium]